jgi:predicted CXXCH cytochrome family protein
MHAIRTSATQMIKFALIGSALLVFSPSVLMAQTIVSTKHDLSGGGYGTTQVCIFCHAPHSGMGTTQLWNHAATAATFTVYNSESAKAKPGQPGATSKLCLSCHDGTVAIDSYGKRAGTKMIDQLQDSTGKLGIDLTNDHPIGFAYNGQLVTADGALVDPAQTGLPLYSGNVECSTCHAVHDPTNGAFLRFTNAGSNLCLMCHKK